MKIATLRLNSMLYNRWRKSAAELELMRQSAESAAEGITQCMQLSQPGVQEHRLAATFGEASQNELEKPCHLSLS